MRAGWPRAFIFIRASGKVSRSTTTRLSRGRKYAAADLIAAFNIRLEVPRGDSIERNGFQFIGLRSESRVIERSPLPFLETAQPFSPEIFSAKKERLNSAKFAEEFRRVAGARKIPRVTRARDALADDYILPRIARIPLKAKRSCISSARFTINGFSAARLKPGRNFED
jgi:hypothetical protein